MNENCPCKRIQCERHGNCAACKEHHYTKKKYLPACERIKAKAEKAANKKTTEKKTTEKKTTEKKTTEKKE